MPDGGTVLCRLQTGAFSQRLQTAAPAVPTCLAVAVLYCHELA